jgi:hypothetical protein
VPRRITTTIRLDPEDVRALKVALFISTDVHLGEESELYKDFRD